MGGKEPSQHAFREGRDTQCLSEATRLAAGHCGHTSPLVAGPLLLETTQTQTRTHQTKHNSDSSANLGTICHLKSANPCNIGCSHVKQMGSGRARGIDNPARSNFLSFNEGWRERLTKCPLITSLFLCVCLGGRQRECVYVMKR